MAFGIGSFLKDVVQKVVPKELTKVATVAAMIPGPHQPFAIAAASLGGYRDGGFKGSLKAGLGAYAGGKFTSGIAQGAGATGYFGSGLGSGTLASPGMFSGFNEGTASLGSSLGNVPVVGDAGRFAGQGGDFIQGTGQSLGSSVSNLIKPSGQLPSGAPKGSVETFPGSGDFYFPEGQIPTSGNFLTEGLGKLAKDPNLLRYALEFGSGALGQYLQNKENEQYEGPGYGNYSDVYSGRKYKDTYSNDPMSAAKGGRIGRNLGGSIPQTPNVPQGMQLEGRGGGFIPMGAKEMKDDVPAMLAKNEFVMTADAVRAAGGGSVDLGAQRMYDVMNQLEAQA